MPTGMAIRKSLTVGAVPRSICETSVSGESTSRTPTATSRTCVKKSARARKMFSPADSLTPTTLIAARTMTTPTPKMMSAGRLAERLPEDPEVVGHEEGRDRDRDDVGQHLAPRREEGPELVEGSARERGGAAGLRVHRRPLGVGRGRAGEDQAGDDEDHRREPQRQRRDQPEGVVDRRADVAVGRAEQRARAEHPFQPLMLRPALRHFPGRLQRRPGGHGPRRRRDGQRGGRASRRQSRTSAEACGSKLQPCAARRSTTSNALRDRAIHRARASHLASRRRAARHGPVHSGSDAV